jgi:hypothetical protein
VTNKKLKVLGVPWHTTHQYSLGNISFFERYDLLIEPWRGGFAETQRPMPEKMHYVTHIKPNYYDFALLHLDQQSIWDPENDDRISKGRLFTEVKEMIKQIDPDLPIVIINHHCPYHDKYSTPETIQKIKKQAEGCSMICNSHEARRQWGWGHVITHGLEADDWGYDVEHYNKTDEKIEAYKEPRVAIVQSPAGMEKAYRRIFLTRTIEILREKDIPVTWVGVDIKFKTWDDYRDFLAKSLVFLHGTWQSPRPRSRTEAMLSGACVVTTPYHDADTFIKTGYLKNGELHHDKDTNGFLTSMETIKDPRVMDNPEYTASLIENLVLENPDVAIKIGRRGREFAKKEMNHEIFERQWADYLKELKIYSG